MKLLLFVSARQLWARRGLNGIAISGVFLGVLTLVVISGIMDGSGEKFFSTILQISPHLVVKSERLEAASIARPPGFEGPSAVSFVTPPRAEQRLRIQRPREVVSAIQELGGVIASSPYVAGTVIIASGARERAIELRAVDVLGQDRVTPLSQYVTSGTYAALAAVPDGVMLGSLLADDLGVKVGDRVTCSAQGHKTSLVLTSIFASGIAAADRSRVYVNLRAGQSLLGKGDDIDGIEVRIEDPARAREVTSRVERTFGYDAESWQEANANFLALIDEQDVIVKLVLGALLAVGGFGILSIQIMIVGQKRRDIAILRSVGFRRADILTVFLAQGIVVALLGSLMGSVVGHFLLSWMRTWPAVGTVFKAEFMPIKESAAMYGYAAAFAVFVGGAASLFPAWRASKVEPVDVLRGQT